MADSQSQHWRFRREGDANEGVVVSTAEGLNWIDDEILSGEDQVSPADRTEWTELGDHPYWGEQIPTASRLKTEDEEEADPDMTSMIDVVFLLIIFFMVAATLTVQKSLDSPTQKQVDGAGVQRTESELKEENVFVTLSPDGTVDINGQKIGPENYDTLLDKLKTAISEMDNSEMILDAPDDVKHEYVIAVLDAAAGAEVNKVLFAVRSGAGGG
ncbi:MAG: biopolymer transporter ExbD [Pirellulales bacterium]|nr:biopolymer transporter ExbD [Pirellulales bacterium]